MLKRLPSGFGCRRPSGLAERKVAREYMDAPSQPRESLPPFGPKCAEAAVSYATGGSGEVSPNGVRRLVLSDFRSYAALDLGVDSRLVVLTGENGAGKTNLLEALSLLAPGRGLRRAELADCARQGGNGGFAVAAEIATLMGPIRLGTGIEPPSAAGPRGRKYRLNGEPVTSIRTFCDHIRVVWLTPSMDGLFNGPASERRRFLDRLVLAIDADHGARVNAFEQVLRGRNRLLEEGRGDDNWLDAVEAQAAELAVAIAAARIEAVARLSAFIHDTQEGQSPFPFAELAIEGEVEQWLEKDPAIEAEDRYRAVLRANRWRDAAARRTLVGPQASDLRVRHGPKNIEATLASTGEQKALLTGLVLAHARLVAALSGLPPLVLLDEIAAHFDPPRRAALFDVVAGLAGQVWLTGADRALFASLEDRALMLTVRPGFCGTP